MNIKDYIASGILDEYCMGMLGEQECLQVEQMALTYPEIEKEIDDNLLALEEYASSFERQPQLGTKEKILALIENLEKEENAQPGNLPLINRFSSHENWLKTIKPLLPPSTDEDVFVKILRNDSGVFQAVLWLKSYYPDEVHTKVQESALVLQGECCCIIEDEEIQLKPGGYLEIPFNAHHNIQVTNGPVLAIIQRLKVA